MGKFGKIFISLLIAFNVFVFGFIYTKIVEATGGAFPYTKMGAKTPGDNGTEFGGARRKRGNNSTNYGEDSGGTGNDPNKYVYPIEVYGRGECTQCHEPHASYGGAEPYPNKTDKPSYMSASEAEGPDDYLLFADNNEELCFTCHETMDFLSDTKDVGWGFYGFFRGRSNVVTETNLGSVNYGFINSGHFTNSTFLWPGLPLATTSSIHPRNDRSSTGTAGICLNCHTPHGIRAANAASAYDTGAVPATKQTTGTNPSVTENYLIPRHLIAWEEALCENCHQSGAVAQAPDVKTDLDRLGDVASGGTADGSGHAVHNVDNTGNSAGTTFSGRHSLGNEVAAGGESLAASPGVGLWNAYSNNTRHVECYDCHNPHVVQKAGSLNVAYSFQRTGEGQTWNSNRGADETTQVLAGPANWGVFGVDVVATTGSTSFKKSVEYLSDLCLKCHSTFADAQMGTKDDNHKVPSWKNKARWDGNLTYLGGNDEMYLTNVATDFSTNGSKSGVNKGYHPVLALGRNNPGSTDNPRWAVTSYSESGTGYDGTRSGTRATGIRSGATGFQNNFVPPFGPAAYITCIDCHVSQGSGNDNTEWRPRGPHGSSRPYIFRKLDTGVSYTVTDDGYSGNGSGTYSVSYSSFQFGYNESGGNYFNTVNLGSRDPNNFCLNCHRADVYGFYGNSTSGDDDPDDEQQWPRYGRLARIAHPVDNIEGMGRSFSSRSANGDAGYPPRGIICLRCHGGGLVGGLHGNIDNDTGAFNYDVTNFTPSSNRLLNGLAWTGVRFGSLASSGGCYKDDGSGPFNQNGCTDDKNDLGAFVVNYEH